MEKEINTNLIFVKPEHYNQMLDLFVREQERKKEENTLYVKIVHVNDFVILFYLCSVLLCPNGYTHLRPVIYLQ